MTLWDDFARRTVALHESTDAIHDACARSMSRGNEALRPITEKICMSGCRQTPLVFWLAGRSRDDVLTSQVTCYFRTHAYDGRLIAELSTSKNLCRSVEDPQSDTLFQSDPSRFDRFADRVVMTAASFLLSL